MASARKQRQAAQQELASLMDVSKARGDAMASARRQIMTVAKVVGGALIAVWILAFGFWSGLKSNIPLYVAGVLTVAVAIGAFLLRRNLAKSEEIGGLLAGGADLSAEDRSSRIDKLASKVEKGDASAIMATAQLQMNEEPRAALETLEKANLDKIPKMVAHQVRGMRAMIHLNLGEVSAARELSDDIDLGKLPDPKAKANLAGVISEAWARSGNPIEGMELLNKYDPADEDYEDVKVQLYRARAFACAHKNDLGGMRRALKELTEISPQLLAVFVGQKRVHPLLQKEARKRLEKSGLTPRVKIQGARR